MSRTALPQPPFAIKSLLLALGLCLGAVACTPGAQAEPVQPTARQPAPPAPDFQGIHRWINSPPLRMSQLRGQVVLVEFWTYACINCLHVQPHINRWHARYRDQGLAVVGVHTPEYDYEHLTGNVQSAVKRLGIEYPVAQDNDYATWNAYGNRFWPALYLIDRDGRIVYRHYGEGDYEQTEAMIRELLAQR